MKQYRLVLLGLVVAFVLAVSPGWAQQPKPGGALRLALAGDLTFSVEVARSVKGVESVKNDMRVKGQ